MNGTKESEYDRNRPLHFEEVRAAEIKAGCPPEGKGLGLAFSGGGIRSATFNLGVTQALADMGLLQRFDYLSTISGGGYIGGWLSLFIKRCAGGKVADAEKLMNQRDKDNLEPTSIRFLRAFSNYLTPRIGMSMDTLVAVATYLRNLMLNLCILVTLMAALLILPRIAALAAGFLVSWDAFGCYYNWIIIAFLFFPILTVTLGLFYSSADAANKIKPADATKARRTWPWFVRSTWLILAYDIPVILAAFLAVCFYLQSARYNEIDIKYLFRTTLAVYALLWLIGGLLSFLFSFKTKQSLTNQSEIPHQKAKWLGAFILSMPLASLAGGAVILGIAMTIAAISEPHRLWAAVAFGPPSVIVAFLIMLTVYIGLMGRKFDESDRELWSVYGGRLMGLSLSWAIFFAIAFYGAAILGWANSWVVGMGGVTWIATTLFGVLAGKSKATGGQASKGWLEMLTHVAPWVFVLGLLFVLSWGLHMSLIWPGDLPARSAESPSRNPPGIYLRAEPDTGKPVFTVRNIDKPEQWDRFLKIAAEKCSEIKFRFKTPWTLPILAALALLAALLLSWRVNINLFSLHHFYRNRLSRCYLGATNTKRRPHPLTGFDPGDDVTLAELAGQRPFPIVGTAINLNRGRQLAWQNRRAASFAFTPLYTGYEPASHQVKGGYRLTAEYGKDSDGRSIQLGTVMAISGAAATPNQGFHTSPAVAFLMTVFNARLGHWCGDPVDKKAWRRRDPGLSLRYWLAELTGTADLDRPFVSLSDGGHFENLGIYELVRRRCSVILASDAGCDPKYAFDDLAEAIRKCYTDFGVEFEFRTKVDAIRPQGDDKLPAEDRVSERHYAVAEIKYPGEKKQTGTLIYLKSSLTRDLPSDIMHYRRTHGNFPHESTADQFFDESQFESYRHLGYEVVIRSLAEIRQNNKLPPELR
ncbi:Patatin-like phospholipase [Syntrophus gentianae]|uniref:Patatin-like phospholipase n=1 Tax=Syntrophus gentianae TaxID=43775 RepID=A0A1H8A6W5_9BACT|nr:patatin-like phospholipase family protein [Syntrophus gentianae]SEM66632.1 Patatin-like phospholipase [Syntrophus gentianae]